MKKPSIGKAILWGLIIGILVGWIPVIGALVAGTVAGKKARSTVGSIVAAILPAALLAGAFYWLSIHPIKIGSDNTTIGEFFILGLITAVCLIGSAMMAARPGFGRLIGLLLVIGGIGYFGYEAPAIWSAGKAVWSLTQKAPEASKTAGGRSCPENLKALYNAALNYADGHDGKLPSADKWVDELKANVKDEELRCPEVKGGGYGYSMNPALGGKAVESFADKSKTALFYDSTETTANSHAGLDSVPKPGRHGGQNNVIYLDGQVQSVTP